jgi:hypothetical protein
MNGLERVTLLCNPASGNTRFRGHLNVSDSIYNLKTKGLESRLFFGHQLQLLVNKCEEKSVEN